MKNILAKTFKMMPSSSRLTIPPVVRFFSDIREGDMIKVWITDDYTIHIRKVRECDGCIENKTAVSVDSIVELLNTMSSDDKVRVIQGITPPCFEGGIH